jgi:hypothetical protein
MIEAPSLPPRVGVAGGVAADEAAEDGFPRWHLR